MDLRAIFLPAQKLTAIISVAQDVNAKERINVDMMLNQSIQRWEYEGGRIVSGGAGFKPRSDSAAGFVPRDDSWFQRGSLDTSENAATKKQPQTKSQHSN